MTRFEAEVAILNDSKKLNNRRVARLLVDILRDANGDLISKSLEATFKNISREATGLRSEFAQKAVNELESANSAHYEDYISRLRNNGIEFIHLFDSEYPDSLWKLEDQPLALYRNGITDLNRRNIAIVGTRKATDPRKEFTETIAVRLAEEKFVVVSGLARGIDAAAHQGSIKGEGETLAILPGDIEEVYPKSNGELAEDIKSAGSLVSEISQFESMHNGRYIQRNRITSGISEAIIVMASGETGGTVRQAEIAKEQSKPRFIYNPETDDGQTPKKLLEMGFKPFSDADELVQLINESENLFDTTTTKHLTLSDF